MKNDRVKIGCDEDCLNCEHKYVCLKINGWRMG